MSGLEWVLLVGFILLVIVDGYFLRHLRNEIDKYKRINAFNTLYHTAKLGGDYDIKVSHPKTFLAYPLILINSFGISALRTSRGFAYVV